LFATKKSVGRTSRTVNMPMDQANLIDQAIATLRQSDPKANFSAFVAEAAVRAARAVNRKASKTLEAQITESVEIVSEGRIEPPAAPENTTAPSE
jgi:hypothetical protein